MGQKKKFKLLQRAKTSPRGWTVSELKELYSSFGFIITNGSSHDIAKHPDLRSKRRATITRSSGDISPAYVTTAVELITELLDQDKG